MKELYICKETHSLAYLGLPCISVSSVNIGHIAGTVNILHILTSTVCISSPILSMQFLFKLWSPMGCLF